MFQNPHSYPLPFRECLKTLRSPFDKPVLSEVEGLRANGASIEILDHFPFMLSLSKHETLFLSTLFQGEGVGAIHELPLHF
jgi:hypothetical protein